MEKLKFNEQAHEIIVTPEDVESAIRQFICTCMPDYNKGWALSPKYELGTIVFACTKE